MKINYTFEIDAMSAFQMLCETLKMGFVLDEDTDFRYHKGKVYVMRNGQENDKEQAIKAWNRRANNDN